MNYKINIMLSLFVGYLLCMFIENKYENYEENVGVSKIK